MSYDIYRSIAVEHYNVHYNHITDEQRGSIKSRLYSVLCRVGPGVLENPRRDKPLEHTLGLTYAELRAVFRARCQAKPGVPSRIRGARADAVIVDDYIPSAGVRATRHAVAGANRSLIPILPDIGS